MRFTLVLISMLSSVLCLYGKIWIVDNNPISVGDFTSLSDAHAAATTGDTIFVYPSSSTYAGITVTKTLYFLGVGFNLNIYGGQASNTTSRLTDMIFNTGSDGSCLEGFAGDFRVIMNTDNIAVKKCDLGKVEIAGSNCVVMQSEIIGSQYYSACVLITQPNLSNILISNNKIHNTYYLGSYWAINGNDQCDVNIINNVINAGDAVGVVSTSSLVQNNIIIRGGCHNNPIYQHNMSNSDQLPVGNGNIINVDMNTAFEDPSDFTTGLHLLPTSPAIGAGFNGTDMGIYGGNTPFVDGGYPNLPAIYYLETEATTTPHRGLNILIKSKSNKE